MKKILTFLFVILAIAASSPARAFVFQSSLDLDYQTLSLKDSADSIYIGEFNKGGSIGVGGHADWLFELSPGFSIGPNFDFSYGQIDSTWYAVRVYQPSAGASFEWKMGHASLLTYFNYIFGWVNTDQEITASGSPAPAGSFAANYYGLLLGLRSRIPLTDHIIIGPYVTYGMPSLLAFKYKSLNSSGQYENQWINIDTTFLRFGLSIYFDQFMRH